MTNSYKDFKKDLLLLEKELTSLQYKVTQKAGTEMPFQNEFWNHKAAGIYVDVVSGEPLFASIHKFDSGTGWPSFYQVIDNRFITLKEDYELLTLRTEVRSHFADSHLGHVFNDGPLPTGLRYCINSAALRFIKKEDLHTMDYGDLVPMFSNEVAVEGQDDKK